MGDKSANWLRILKAFGHAVQSQNYIKYFDVFLKLIYLLYVAFPFLRFWPADGKRFA